MAKGEPQDLSSWGQIVESTVDAGLRKGTHQTEGLPKRFRGRCKPKKAVLAPWPARTRLATNGDYHPIVEPVTFQGNSMVPQLRRLQSLQRRLCQCQQYEIIWHRTLQNLQEEWMAILSFRFQGQAFPTWVDSHPELCHCPTELPSETWLSEVVQLFRHHVDIQLQADHQLKKNVENLSSPIPNTVIVGRLFALPKLRTCRLSRRYIIGFLKRHLSHPYSQANLISISLTLVSSILSSLIG